MKDVFDFGDNDAPRIGNGNQTKEPWWNDGDKVGGCAATMVLLTVVAIICLGLIAGAVKLFF